MNIIIKKIFIGAAALDMALASTGASADWFASIDESHGFPVLVADGAEAIRSDPVAWGAQWAWAPSRFKLSGASSVGYTIQGEVPDLGLSLTADVRKANDNTQVWNIDFNATRARTDIVGVGLSFKLGVEAFAASLGSPQLLPNRKGWRWGDAASKRWIEVRYDPAPPSVYFEQGKKNDIRTLFFKDTLPAGSTHYTMTVQWGADAQWRPMLAERLGGPPVTQWPTNHIDTRSFPLSLAFLNDGDRPAGRHGPMRVQDGTLAFSDGTSARFWGTNITAYALFQTPRDDVRRQAKRLAAMGYNLARLHHHDSPWVEPNVLGTARKPAIPPALDATAMDKLDWWIKCLKDEGIYVWLDLHVLRALRHGDDIDGFNEVSKGKDNADLRGYNYVNPSIRSAMKRFNDAYLNHQNPYTGWMLKDDPAIATALITNEDDATWHFGNNLLPDKGVPFHSQAYISLAKQFAAANKLPADKVWRAWEQGPSKLFLNDLEHRFDTEMIQHLRAQGFRSPIATTSTWGGNGLNALPALTSGDLIDVHAYERSGMLERNPSYGATSAHWIAAAHVTGLPLTVSEWNMVPFPTYDRHVLPLYLAATADHQGWHALMQYAYTQEAPWTPGAASNYHTYNDPSVLAMLPAAALLFREQHVRPASTTYVYDAAPDRFYGEATAASNAPALRTAMEKGRLLIAMPKTQELPWLERKPWPNNAIVLRDPSTPVIPSDAQETTTDTGEIRRQWTRGTYTINTPLTQAALGWIGSNTIGFPAVDIQFKTRHASVAVQSLDRLPLGQSGRVLVSIGTRSLPSAGNKAPFTVEPAEGSLRIKAPAGLKAYRNGPLNQWLEWPASYANGQYTVNLDGTRSIQWLMLRASAPSQPGADAPRAQ